jgi:hypothetical protein
MRKALVSVLAVLCSTVPTLSEAAEGNTVAAVRQWRQANEREIVREFTEFVRLPNESRDRDNILNPQKRKASLRDDGEARLIAPHADNR